MSLITATFAYLGCGNLPEKTSAQLPDEVSFNFHVRPILSDKCFACHGPDANKREANFRLDQEETALAPLTETKGAFAIVRGKPDQSEIIKRIVSDDPHYQMPTPDSHLGRLTEYEIEILKKWIRQGAKYEKHWAFIPPVKQPLPTPDISAWCRNELDLFVLDQMQNQQLKPNEESDPERLLKRLSFDLTGLPPSLAMMDKFLAEPSSKAYETLVDSLLATPSYGERMAIQWLDLARYADSYGYQDDNIRSQWPYRDWVIHAFNNNIPYDSFLVLQIAGDLLPSATKEQVLATAFLRNHKYTEEGGVLDEEYRVEYNLDKTKTFGKGILGMTIECAQCHDHKFDPFSQKDYYSLYAFFNNTSEVGFEGDIGTSKPAKRPVLKISRNEIQNLMSFINHKDTAELMVSVMEDNDTVRKTYLLDRGLYDKPKGEQILPAALPSVLPFDTTVYPRNRLGLARWTVSKNNPLTARVYINLLWQSIFGRGLVKTPGDFGMQGALPSHPALLDWLAVDFMENGWNIKRMMKMMVMSATYRQASKISSEKWEADRDNIYLARSPRQRLKAEHIRDHVLSSSGLLVTEVGGPSVKPYHPEGLWESATSGRGVLAVYRQDHGKSLYRRGLYTFIKLTVPPPSMIIFDASNRDQCEVERANTSTPLQALVMMNDPMVLEASRVLAQNLLADKTLDAEEKIKKAFRLIICRVPKESELKLLVSYHRNQQRQFNNKTLDAAAILRAGEFPAIPGQDAHEVAALMKTINAIYNLEEAITKS